MLASVFRAFVVRIDASVKATHPYYVTEMVAIVLVPTTSKDSRQPFTGIITHGCDGSIEVVAHLFATDKVAILTERAR